MGPLIPFGIIDPAWSQVIAVLLGMAFGFVLEGTGFSSSRKLAGVFYGYDFTVLRVFFTAGITAAIGLLYFNYMGWVDMSLIYVNPTFMTATIAGSVIMGLGFVTGGFCPGTSYAAAAIGKLDAWVYTVGLFLGIFLFSEFYPFLEGIYNGQALGSITMYEIMGISAELFMLFLVVFALIAFYAVTLIRRRVKPVEY